MGKVKDGLCVFGILASLAGTPAALAYDIAGSGYRNCAPSSYGSAALQTCTMNYSADGTNPNNEYDVHLPPGFDPNQRYPLVIWVHGGGWSQNSSRLADDATTKNIASYGYIVANIEYTRSPYNGGPYNAGPDDVREFTRWVFSAGVGDLFKINQSRISIAGTSAGGYMALLEATRGIASFYAVAVGSAPTAIMPVVDVNADYKAEFPASIDVVRSVFGSDPTELRNKTPDPSRLLAQYLFMEHSRTDSLVPYALFENFARGVPCGVISELNAVPGLPPGPQPSHNMTDSKLTDFFRRLNSPSSQLVYANQMTFGKSNDQMNDSWSALNVVDRNYGNSYSSNLGDRFNSTGFNLEAHFLHRSRCSKQVSTLVLRARMLGATPLGFPASYDVFVTDPTNSRWIFKGTFQTQPSSSGRVRIPLGTIDTHGVLIVPTELGKDNDSNYYFQMNEVELK